MKSYTVLGTNHGMSLIEVMIAAVMLVVIALATANFVSSSKVTNVKAYNDYGCHQRAEQILAQIKNYDNQRKIDNWHSCSDTVTTGTKCVAGEKLPATSGLNHPERFITAPSPAYVNGSGNTPYELTSAYQLMDDATNIVLNVKNSTPAACSDVGPGVQIGAGLNPIIASSPTINIAPVGTPLTSELDFLNIHLYDMKTAKKLLCPTVLKATGYTGPQRVVPIGAQNLKVSSGGLNAEANLGLLVTATVQYVDKDGITQKCDATNVIGPEGDTVPPKFFLDPEGTNCNLPAQGIYGPTCTPGLTVANMFTTPFPASGMPGAKYPNGYDCSWYNHYICFGSRPPWPKMPLAYYPLWTYTKPPNPPTIPNQGDPPKVFCGSSTVQPDIHFQVGVSEPGVIFLCRFESNQTVATSYNRAMSATMHPNGAPPAPPYLPLAQPSPTPGGAYQPCDGGTFVGADGSTTFKTSVTQVTNKAVNSDINKKTAIEVKIGGSIPEGFYTMYIKAVDSAQNESVPMSESFAVDLTRPDGLTIVPPSATTEYWLAKPTNSNGRAHYAPAGARWYIDNYPINVQSPANPLAITPGTKALCNAGAIFPPVSPLRNPAAYPASLATGTHTIKAEACDVCEEVNTIGAQPAPFTVTTSVTLPLATPVPLATPGPCSQDGDVSPCTTTPFWTHMYSSNIDTTLGVSTAFSIYSPPATAYYNVNFNAPVCVPPKYGNDHLLYPTCPVILFPNAWCGSGDWECSSGKCVNNRCTSDGVTPTY